MAQHNDLGKWGEELAREYLIINGYTLVATDNRNGHFEIDIIALKDDRIIFVEVKTRGNGSSDPLDAITPQKIRRLCSAASSYVKQFNFLHKVQFDIITIIGDSNCHKLTHYPDAFRPPLRGSF